MRPPCYTIGSMSEQVDHPSTALPAGASSMNSAAAPNSPNTRSRTQRWVRRLAWTGGGILVVWGVGWLVVPPLAKWQAQKQASAMLGRKVTIGEIDFRPWSLELTLKQLQVANAAGTAPQFSIDRVYVDAAAQSLFRLAPVLDAIQIDAPKVAVRHLGNGHYDFDDILQRLAARPVEPADPQAKPARFALYNVAVSGGQFTFDDDPVSAHHELRALDLRLPFISNLDSQREVKVLPHLAFLLDGSQFDSSAETLPFVDTRKTNARFKIDALDLQDYAAYIPAHVPVALKSAVLDADLTVSFEQQQQPSLRVSGSVSARDFDVQERDGTPLAAFKRLELDLADVRPFEQRIHLSAVRLTQPKVRLMRDPNGVLNLMRMAKASAQGPVATNAGNGAANPVAVASGAAAAASAGKPAERAASASSGAASGTSATATALPMAVQVDHIQVVGGTVAWLDQSAGVPGQPAHLQLSQLQVDAADLVLPMGKPVRFSGSGVLTQLDAVTPAVATTAPAATATPVPAGKVDRANAPATQVAPANAALAKRTPAVAVAASSAPASAPLVLAPAKTAPVPQTTQATPGAANAPANAPTSAPIALPVLKALADMPSGGLSFAGQATDREVSVSTHIQALPLDLAGPYARVFLAQRVGGQLTSASELHWAASDAKGEGGDLRVRVKQLTLDEVRLLSANAGEGIKAVSVQKSKNISGDSGVLPQIKQIQVDDVDVQVLAQRVSVGKLSVTEPRMQVTRNAKGHFMYEDWLVPASAAAGAAPSTGKAAAPAWQVELADVQVKGGRVGWRDEQPDRPVDVQLSDLGASVKGFVLGGKAPMQVQLTGRLGAGRLDPGRLSWQGAITQTPLSAKGEVNLQRLPVHAFEPYFGDLLNIELLRADASFKGKVDFASSDKGPRIKLVGDTSVEEFRAHSVSGSITDANAPTAPAATTTERGRSATQTTTVAPVVKRGQAQREQGDAKQLVASAADARAGGTGSVTSGAPLAPISERQGRGGLRLGEELLSWKTLHLRGLDVTVQPGQRPVVNVAQTQLADFFARVVVYPSGRLNLQDLVKAKPGEEAAAALKAAASNAATASTASPAVAAASAPAVSAASDTGPVLRFGPTKLVGGKVYFSDRFIKPNYSADLTELNGSLNAFSSEADPSGAVQMAELALSGRAEGTAQLNISGKVNPLAKPLALDVTAKVSDLELPPLSPYAIKYAGYGIERGKMSVNVRYEVLPNGQLTATNNVVLNQLTFGEKVEGAPASLPVKLAVTLLSDRNGVIDLDLPISGSLNDPQFSVGPIVVKAIVNIIGKAITAPFSLLAKAFGGGGGDEMSQVAFTSGSSALSPQSQQKLDKVAKALIDRPSLKLTVSGRADLDSERAGYQRERLKALVAAEKRRDDVTGKKADGDATAMPAMGASAPALGASAPAVPATALAAPEIKGTEYDALLKKVYKRADIKKPRNAVGLAKDLPAAEMERLLMDSIPVGENQMRLLAQARATAVRDYLGSQKLTTDRLFVGSSQLGTKGATAPDGAASAPAAAGGGAKSWSPHAELSLKND